MSYSETYQVTKSNSPAKNEYTTPLKIRYNEELMFYVYQLVVEAEDNKTDRKSNDLNSVDSIIEAKNRANESLSRSLI